MSDTVENTSAVSDNEDAGEDYYSDSDDSVIDSDDENIIRQMGANPRMKKIQERLFKQLSKEMARQDAELRDLIEEKKRLESGRETVGVNLYNQQQHLGKLQRRLEIVVGNSAKEREERLQAEKDSKRAEKAIKLEKQGLDEENRKFLKAKAELDALQATLKSMNVYNEEISSKVAVLRRETYKTEKEVRNAEKNKQKQDFLIDGLNEKIAQLREEIALNKEQYRLQKTETESAEETLKESEREMNKITFEKQQLMQQWKAALVGINQRDVALQAIKEALRKQQEQSAGVEAEIEGYKAETRNAQLENERLYAEDNRLEVQITQVQQKINDAVDTREKLAERYALLKKSLEQTDLEAKRVNQEKKNLQDQVNSLQQNFLLVQQERHELEAGVALNANTQTTVSKAVSNLKKKAAAVSTRVHEKENEMASIENEVARMHVDALNTKAHNKILHEKLDSCNLSLKERDALIAKYEMEIRQRNDSVEKKMLTVDRLNRRLEQLTGKNEDINHGPLEATIKSLEKSISSTNADSVDIQREWLKSQTNLVDLTTSIEKLRSYKHRCNGKMTVYSQKKLRSLANVRSVQKDLAGLDRGIQGMHTEMDKLNGLIAKNVGLKERLDTSSNVMRQEFMAELHELEQTSIRIDADIRGIKEAKEQLKLDIMEMQRQIVLWERKIILEKETQEALDPTIGRDEEASMKTEIHRMQLRMKALQRRQDEVLKEMEIAIDKRESIAVRHRGKKSHGKSKTALKSRIIQLKKTLSTTKKDIQHHAQLCTEASQEQEDLERRTSEYAREQEALDEEVKEMQEKINNMLYEKQRVGDTNAMMQRLLRKYKTVNSPNPPQPSSPRSTLRLLTAAEDEQQDILKCIEQLQSEFSHLSDVLSRVGALTQIECPI